MADALQSILTQVGVALAPLRAVDTPAKAVTFFKQLGYDIPPGTFGTALNGLADQGGELVDAVKDLVEASNDTALFTSIANMGVQLVGTVDAIVNLHNQIKSGGGAAIPNIEQLPERLTDFLLLDAFYRLNPTVHGFLHALGLISYAEVPAPGEPVQKVNWNRLGLVFSDPKELFNQTYNWSGAFDYDMFLGRVDGLLRAASLPGGLYPQPEATRMLLGNSSANLEELRFPIIHKGLTPETYAQFGLTFSPTEASGSQKSGIAILPYLMGTSSFDFSVCDKGELVFNSTGSIDGIGLAIRPPMKTTALMDFTAAFNAELILRQKASKTEELIVLGTAGGTRLAIQGLGMSAFINNDESKIDLGWEGHIDALRVVITGGEGDGFLQKVLSNVNIVAEAELGFGYSLRGGFYFRGGAKFGIDLPVHIDLGPLAINGLRIELEPKTDHLALRSGANLKVALGPLQATIEDIGLEASLFYRQGNMGALDLDFGFKPPKGIGLSVDAGAIKGGGYLFLDVDRGEYAGALELVFSEWIALKAIGLINTKMPDGSKGFSMIIIITAEFGTGIQLGFGFTLLGVGGILGLNRVVNVEPLRVGVRTGAIESVMFPQDVVANAPRIISDLRAFFPIKQDAFLVGPMAKIGYGTPTLASISLGLIIEFPDVAITILGVFKVALPHEKAAVLKLQVNFLGRIEPSNSQLWFYAELYDSRILFITLEGGMGLLVNWGNNANFVFSVGGFHPRYNPPALPFNVPPRLAVSILNLSLAKIRIEGYFAVTSNTVQFGARAELFFGFSALKVEGHISFDTLFQFDPFYFIFEFSAGLSIKVFGFGLYTISVSGLLEGPSKWHIKGKAKWKITWFGPTIKINIDETWGEEKQTELEPIAIFPLIEREFDALTNWQAVLPEGKLIAVSLRKLDTPSAQTEPEPNTLVLHPVGKLRISQRKMPLKLVLDKLGTQKPSDVNKLFVSVAIGGGAALESKTIKEKFAEGEFKALDTSKKLSSPGFQDYDGGLELSTQGDETKTSIAVKRVIRYETVIMDSNYKRHLVRFFTMASRLFTGLLGRLFTHYLKGNTITESTLSKSYKTRVQPRKAVIAVAPHQYTVAHKKDNRPVADGTTNTTAFTNMASARDYLEQQQNSNPELAQTMHVIPNTEVNTAA